MTDVQGGLDEPEGLQPESGALTLASPEDDWSRSDWEKAAAAVLRKSGRLDDDDVDAAVWSALTHTTYDGIPISPLGTADLLAGPATRARPDRTGPWDVRVRHEGDNRAILTDLENGATSVWLSGAADLARALEGVMLDLAPVVLEPGSDAAAPAAALVGLARERGAALHPDTNLGADPIGAALRGRSADDDLVGVGRTALEHGVRAIVVDATAAHELGASDAQELGYSLAVGAAYLRLLTEAGISLDDALGLVEFRYAATDEQLPTIAKLRAGRRCWARVVEVSGGDPGLPSGAGRQRQHAVTSRPMLSAYDPWVNMLRTTVAAFAAGVGGADAVTVVPFDSPRGAPDAFSRRIARNVSALLVSESHVAAVADPAGGAFAIERLTDDLALAAWEELGRIEEAGGIRAALDDGSFRGRVEDVARRRDHDVATRTRPITGLSEYPSADDTPAGGEGGDGVRRYGAAFEELRGTPAVGHVFLATMGPVAAHNARAGFATNLFVAGAVTVDAAGATRGVDDVLAAYDGQPVVCLAGTDTAYAEWGDELATALRGAGAQRVVVIGVPTGSTAARSWADDTFGRGDDAVDFLTRTREALR